MEASGTVVTSHASFCINQQGTHVLFFTTGECSILLHKIGEQCRRRPLKKHLKYCGTSRLKSNTIYVTSKPVQHANIRDKKLYIFHEQYFVVYSLEDGFISKTVVIPHVLAYFRVKNKEFYLGKDKVIQHKGFNPPKEIKIQYCSIIRDKYLAIQSKNTLKIFSRNGLVYKGRHPCKICSMDIRNEKVYIHTGNKIAGHDLNVYLSDIGPVQVASFVNIKDRLILMDCANKSIRIYEKNLVNLTFCSNAEHYAYSDTRNQLYTLFDGVFTLYNFIDPYSQPFKLVENSYVYLEREDEFDCSDDKYSDFTKE